MDMQMKEKNELSIKWFREKIISNGTINDVKCNKICKSWMWLVIVQKWTKNETVKIKMESEV